VASLPDLNGAKAISVSSSGNSSPCIRLHLLFAPAPYPLVTYDLKLGASRVPYVTISGTGTCGAVGGEEGTACICRASCGSQEPASSGAAVAYHVPVCVCVSNTLVVMGAGGSAIFALRLGHGMGGFTEVAVGGDSDVMLMLPKGKGGGGHVQVMRWIAAIKLRDQSLPQQVLLLWWWWWWRRW
jgi:hypothetical protein